jgi:hypothetical protein
MGRGGHLLPPFLRRLKMFDCCKKNVGSFLESVGKIVHDPELVEPQISKQRLDVCNNCEKFSNGICKECGCIMAIKTKFKVMVCPLEKW